MVATLSTCVEDVVDFLKTQPMYEDIELSYYYDLFEPRKLEDKVTAYLSLMTMRGRYAAGHVSSKDKHTKPKPINNDTSKPGLPATITTKTYACDCIRPAVPAHAPLTLVHLETPHPLQAVAWLPALARHAESWMPEVRWEARRQRPIGLAQVQAQQQGLRVLGVCYQLNEMASCVRTFQRNCDFLLRGPLSHLQDSTHEMGRVMGRLPDELRKGVRAQTRQETIWFGDVSGLCGQAQRFGRGSTKERWRVEEWLNELERQVQKLGVMVPMVVLELERLFGEAKEEYGYLTCAGHVAQVLSVEVVGSLSKMEAILDEDIAMLWASEEMLSDWMEVGTHCNVVESKKYKYQEVVGTRCKVVERKKHTYQDELLRARELWGPFHDVPQGRVSVPIPDAIPKVKMAVQQIDDFGYQLGRMKHRVGEWSNVMKDVERAFEMLEGS